MDYLLLISLISFSFQNAHSFDFIRELLFPQYPVLHKVRNFESARYLKEYTVLDFVGIVEKQGYLAEEHQVKTEDGYKLTIHRISGSAHSPPQSGKPVVFLQHGLLGSSDLWVLMGAQKDLAFLLADNGYDVWLGNVRGNTYSRSHEELTTLDPEFWNFNFHEIGYYDLPAMIDYSLMITGQKALYYIGHSMGTTVSYVLLSTRPSYNEKMKLVVSLAPVAYWSTRPTELIYTFLQEHASALKIFFDRNNIYDLFPQSENNPRLAKGICTTNSFTQSVCSSLLFSFVGMDSEEINNTLIPYISHYWPAGASVQTIFHYSQNIKKGKFQAYDFGYTTNYKTYGAKQPPLYNTKKITAPVAIFYSRNDPIVIPNNIMELVQKLTNVVELHKLPYKNFSHLDFIWAEHARQFLYYRILNILKKY